MLIFIRFLFGFLGVCGLVFTFEFAKAFSTMLLANNISMLFFTSLLFSMTSVAASMVAFYAMRQASQLKPKQRMAYAVAYMIMLLPSVMIILALNQLTK